MTDYSELKRLAEVAKEACGDYIPLSDGGMSVHQMIGRIKACESTEPLCEEERTVLLAISRTERDQLKAENEVLRKGLAECATSLEGEMLQKFGGQKLEDMHPVTRRDYDRDMAELAGYRAVMGKGER
jgi:hypothetical protein